jgi:hypothetical protein
MVCHEKNVKTMIGQSGGIQFRDLISRLTWGQTGRTVCYLEIWRPSALRVVLGLVTTYVVNGVLDPIDRQSDICRTQRREMTALCLPS